MTRYVMVADLGAASDVRPAPPPAGGNGTPPRPVAARTRPRIGEYPTVNRVFVPTGCQRCANRRAWSSAHHRHPPADDGIVTIDYVLCIGCASAPSRVPMTRGRPGSRPISPSATADHRRARALRQRNDGVATKCPSAPITSTPATRPAVPSEPRCHAGLRDAHLRCAQLRRHRRSRQPGRELLAENQSVRMREKRERPGLHYLWDKGSLWRLAFEHECRLRRAFARFPSRAAGGVEKRAQSSNPCERGASAA